MPKQNKNITNTHQGHVASCLCCLNLCGTFGENGYSDVTPGSPGQIYCEKQGFPEQQPGDDFVNAMRILHERARHCTLFVAIP